MKTTYSPSLLNAIVRLICALTMTLSVVGADQYPPGKMTFQGFLTDTTTGAPLATSNQTLQFRIYDALTGGVVLWAEEQVVTVDNGHFSVLLGEGGPVNGLADKHSTTLAGIFIGPTASDRFIGVTISGQTEIAPRIQFFAAPYAQMARSAHQLVNPDGTMLLNATSGNALNVSGGISASNLTVAALTTSNLTVKAATAIQGANVVEFGAGVAGKDVNAGKIGYGTFSPGKLDIVGAGTGNNRTIKMWAEGGTSFTGDISVGNNPLSPGGGATIWANGLQAVGTVRAARVETPNISSEKFRVSQPLPSTQGDWHNRTGTFVSGGGTMVITMNVTAYVNTGGTYHPGALYLDNVFQGSSVLGYNITGAHLAAPTRTFIVRDGVVGTRTIRIERNGVISDGSDYSEVTVVEYPF